MKKWLTPNIWKLSIVSLFTDISSEMLYPILPLYMQKIGLNGTTIGLIEGIGESIAAWGKGYFGKLSDDKGTRKSFIVIGYGLSAISKLLLAFSIFPVVIYLARFSDKLGKGIRSSPRDGILANESDKEHLGKVFGFHRSMDTVGAAIGPFLTLGLLYYLQFEYIQIFYIAFIPGMLGWIITTLITETKTEPKLKPKSGYFSFLMYFKNASNEYKKIIFPILIFALFNSSDFFLILCLKTNGFDDIFIIIAYIIYNLSFALFSYPAGYLADKFGFKLMLGLGFGIFILVYSLIGNVHSQLSAILIFILYGIYAAFTDGNAKAWLTKNANKEDKNTAIGFFNAIQSITIVLASLWTGIIVDIFNYQTAFYISAIGAGVSIVLFLFLKFNHEHSNTSI